MTRHCLLGLFGVCLLLTRSSLGKRPQVPKQMVGHPNMHPNPSGQGPSVGPIPVVPPPTGPFEPPPTGPFEPPPTGPYEPPPTTGPVNPTCPKSKCSCNCGDGSWGENKDDESCEWKIVFKAVKGQGHEVFKDFFSGGDINGGSLEAKQIMSGDRFRDAEILDHWEDYYVKEVKVQIFENGLRKAWVVFNARGTGIYGWFTQDRIIDSSYDGIKIGSMDVFSAPGKPSYPVSFVIMRHYSSFCNEDCGYMIVSEGGTTTPPPCPYLEVEARPYFIYGKNEGICSSMTTNSGIGDRFVISVKICDKDTC